MNLSSDDKEHYNRSSLIIQKRHPYYILTPPYTRFSAGVKALHLLCHSLNRKGEHAYLAIPNVNKYKALVNLDLFTPILTVNHIKHHFSKGLTPITIYPEITIGNPLNAPFVIRYVLNFPGLLGGDRRYADDEFIIAYSKILCDAVPNCRNILYIPTSDPIIFSPFPKIERSGTCFYAGKYKGFGDVKLLDITKNSVEITKDKSTSQTQEQIAELFRRSELFYCYENSALITEATLCGCPAVLLQNKYFDKAIGSMDIGWDGIAWGVNPIEIQRAKDTVHLARTNYLKLYKSFENQLNEFIALTQKKASFIKYEKPINIYKINKPVITKVIFKINNYINKYFYE